jgi:hypothetical protein
VSFSSFAKTVVELIVNEKEASTKTNVVFIPTSVSLKIILVKQVNNNIE